MTGIIASIYGFLGSESDIPVPGVRRVVQIKKTHLNIVKLWVHGELNKPDNNSMVKARNKEMARYYAKSSRWRLILFSW